MENMQNNMQSQNVNQPQPLNKKLALICGTIIVACLIIAGTILYTNSKSSRDNVVINGNAQNQQQQQQPTGPVKVSVDNDAVLGDKNAPLTMIEFSDYECPFCKRHFTDVYPQIKKDYIDTGKLKLVYRDFIAVPSHNPLATSEAMAAECAREQGGDSAYFKYHDEIFKRTTSNGNGLAVSQLTVIAKDLGLNSTTLQQCLDSNKYKDEVNKDIADASKVGVNGTPSFFVGKSSQDGTIDGTIIVGAQPYAAFKVIIDEMLK
jgi:protein-disulfide isomerase